VLQDEFAIACIVAIELKARLVCDEMLKKRLEPGHDARIEPDMHAAKGANFVRFSRVMLAAIAVASEAGLPRGGSRGHPSCLRCDRRHGAHAPRCAGHSGDGPIGGKPV
jgi:hypothetical protein